MTLQTLLEKGVLRLALLPENNDSILTAEGKELRNKLIAQNTVEEWHAFSPEKRIVYYDFGVLQKLQGYTVPLIGHDYSAKTPLMWNAAYAFGNLPLNNIMVVGDPAQTKEILEDFVSDSKYLGGGAGVGFKETVARQIPQIGGTLFPIDLTASNIVVKENGKLVGYNTDAEGFVKSLEEALLVGGKSLEKSQIIIFGAGGVAKEVARYLAKSKVSYVAIVNRTINKAVALAHELNLAYGCSSFSAVGVGEDLIRGLALNSIKKPDTIVNLTDKGSDGSLADTSAFAPAGAENETLSRYLLEQLVKLTPNIVVADIVLPKRRSITLRQVDAAWSKANEPAHTLDGKPMVIYQAVPAYKLIEKAYPELHQTPVSPEKLLEIFKYAVTN